MIITHNKSVPHQSRYQVPSTMSNKNNKHYYIFSKFFILLALIHHGLGMDQASSLVAFRHHKMHRPASTYYADEESWTEMSMEGETVSYDVGNMEDDLIKNGLPGQPPQSSKFKQYAGYVNVDDAKGRSLFYYFAEAAEDPSSKPLILWLNGGPGCSSFGEGALVEIGPFGVNPDGKTLYPRKFAWNKVANTLFLESPAGVGFSYSNTTSDYKITGDRSTARDAYTFLVNWFKRFPQYKERDFYVAGESYAGFYIPELADVIAKRNAMTETSKIQLKGIMIGNGIMNDITDNQGQFDYFWSHALISDESYEGINNHCLKRMDDEECLKFREKAGTEIGEIDVYNIYGPLCVNSSNSSPWKIRRHYGYDPCEGNYVDSYLNLPQVQASLHANRTRLPYPWTLCSAFININWADSPSTMFPIYRKLMASGLRILIYSGDVDGVVPVTGTRYSINALNLKVKKQWLPWYDDSEQVAGYRVVYEGLSFATVRGAGHEVPQFQPRRAFALLKLFLENLI